MRVTTTRVAGAAAETPPTAAGTSGPSASASARTTGLSAGGSSSNRCTWTGHGLALDHAAAALGDRLVDDLLQPGFDPPPDHALAVLRARSFGLCDDVPEGRGQRGPPPLPPGRLRLRLRRLRGPLGRMRRRGRPRTSAGRVPDDGRRVRVGELAQGRVRASAAAAVPRPHPPGASVVAVVLRGVVRRGAAGDHPPVRREPANTGLTPP